VAAAWFHGYGYPIYTLTYSSDGSMLERCLRELGAVSFNRWGLAVLEHCRLFEEAQKLTF